MQDHFTTGASLFGLLYVSNTALEAVLREINEISGGDDYEMEDFWRDRYSDKQLEALRGWAMRSVIRCLVRGRRNRDIRP